MLFGLIKSFGLLLQQLAIHIPHNPKVYYEIIFIAFFKSAWHGKAIKHSNIFFTLIFYWSFDSVLTRTKYQHCSILSMSGAIVLSFCCYGQNVKSFEKQKNKISNVH